MSSSNIYNFDADHLGELIATAEWEKAWEYLAQIIENLTMTANDSALAFSLQLQKDMALDEGKKYVNDFGALLGELFLFLLTNEESAMSDKSFERLIYYHETLHTLFYIFDMDDTDAAVNAMRAGSRALPANQQKKLLLLLSMNTSLDISEILNGINATYRASAIVAYFGHRKIFREKIYNNKIKLYSFSTLLRKANEKIKTMANLAHPYFLSSYLKIDDKHRIKKDINIAFKNYLSDLSGDFKNIRALPGGRHVFNLDQGKPTVLVLNEFFARNHAMNRGWGRLIKSLESEFNIILVIYAHAASSQSNGDFKNIFAYSNMGELYDLLYCAKPDMFFMPSVGMKFFNIAMSNMRFAPIQIMGLGHPATSMSEHIDYVVSPKGLYDPKAFPTDTYIADGYPEKHAPVVSKEIFFAPLAPEDMPVRDPARPMVEVCVVGSDIKVSYPFFKLLKEIVAEADFDIHVSFMIGVGGIDSLYIEKFLAENFDNATYYGWQPYPDYLKNLKKADIVLNSFPFGHTNTIIDTLMCGKPCIGLEDIEPAAKTESDVLNAVGLKEMFIAKDEAEYKEKFFHFARKILAGEKVFFDRDKVHDRIFDDLGDYDYGKVFKWIHENHSALKARGLKYYEVFEDI